LSEVNCPSRELRIRLETNPRYGIFMPLKTEEPTNDKNSTCIAILAVCTSAASAKAKPKAAAAATTPSPMMWQPGPTAADKALYAKNQRESGMKK
jgi:hypothetical protein